MSPAPLSLALYVSARAFAEQAPLAASIGPESEDFVVEELPRSIAVLEAHRHDSRLRTDHLAGEGRAFNRPGSGSPPRHEPLPTA